MPQTFDPDRLAPDEAYPAIELGAAELRRLADRARLPMLSYLIGMVQLEASSQRLALARHSRTGESDIAAPGTPG